MRSQLKTYQDWCIDTLLFIYQNRPYYDFTGKDKGYRYAVNALLTNHASMYYCAGYSSEKKYVNLWWDHLNQSTAFFFFRPLLMSASAAKYLEENIYHEGHGKLDKEAIKKTLHFEHITPNGVTIDAIERSLKQQSPTRDLICALLKYHKLVLLTRKERDRYLDGAKDKDDNRTVFTQDDIDLLRRWDRTIQPMAEPGESCKALGNGPLRLAHLVNNNVPFVLHGHPINDTTFFEFEQYFCEPFTISE